MSSEIELTGKQLMENALNELKADPLAKINMNTVAKKAGLSHTLFNKKTYENVKLDVNKEKAIREQELDDISKEQEISVLKSKLEAANRKIERQKEELCKPKPRDIKANEGVMMARLTEMYRFNDLLRAQLREKHGEYIDEKTGEILKVDFSKKR
jgi:hypothetical protein